jgi:uronate dehydrogenase
MFRKLLLTGAAGGLGSVLRQRLRADCEVLRLSDISDLGTAQAGEEILYGDLAKADEVDRLVQGCDVVVHFGGISVEAPFKPLMEANMLGMYNLYQAVLHHGVRRVIFASSNHVTGFYRQLETITPNHPARPDSFYGVSKAFGEDLSRFYFDRYGIETACLRIGSSFSEPSNRRMLSTWLSYDDLYRLVRASLSAPVIGHTIVYGVSNNSGGWWDNAGVRHLGYSPKDSADVYREDVYSSTPAPDPKNPASIYQGGDFVIANNPLHKPS